MNTFRTVILALVLSVAALPAAAGWRGDSHDRDHDRARRSVQAGEVLPLQTILDKVARDFPGDVIETELEDEDDCPVYEIKLISPEGRVMKIIYDARDGRVLKVKGKRP